MNTADTHPFHLIRSRLGQLARDLRTSFRSRRALERDLDAAWAEIGDLRTIIIETNQRLTQANASVQELTAKLRREQCALAHARMEAESHNIGRKVSA